MKQYANQQPYYNLHSEERIKRNLIHTGGYHKEIQNGRHELIYIIPI